MKKDLILYCFDFLNSQRILYFSLLHMSDGLWLITKGTKERSITPAIVDYEQIFNSRDEALLQVISYLNTLEIFSFNYKTEYSLSKLSNVKSPTYSIYSNQEI